MGESPDFFGREGAPDPKLVLTLSELRYRAGESPDGNGRISDPALLARLIDGHCEIDRDFGLAAVQKPHRDLAAQLHTHLAGLRDAARDLLRAEDECAAELLKPTVERLLSEQADVGNGAERVLELLRALDAIASWPLRADNPFKGRPRRNVTAQKVVNAVADYCSRGCIPFVPPRHRPGNDSRQQDFYMSEAALLTKKVLEVCGPFFGSPIDWPKSDQSLQRLMRDVPR